MNQSSLSRSAYPSVFTAAADEEEEEQDEDAYAGKPKRGTGRPLSEVECFRCHKMGHYRDQCKASEKDVSATGGKPKAAAKGTKEVAVHLAKTTRRADSDDEDEDDEYDGGNMYACMMLAGGS